MCYNMDDLENSLLSKKSQSQKTIYDSIFIKCLEEAERWCREREREREGEREVGEIGGCQGLEGEWKWE